jgi:hypothetical protein
MKLPHDNSGRPDPDATLIERLLFQASVERRTHLAISPSGGTHVAAVDEGSHPERVASLILEEVLTSELGPAVNCATYLTRAASLQHMAIPSLNVLMTSVHGIELAPLAGRGLAVALCDLMFYAGGGACNTGSVDLQLAVGMDGRYLAVGLVAYGSVKPVASASATATMLRAAAIVSALRGDFVRAYEPAKMTFGILVPYLDVAVNGTTGHTGRSGF